MVKFFKNARVFLVVLVLLIIFDGIVTRMFLSDIYSRELIGSARLNEGILQTGWMGIGLVYILISFGITYYVVGGERSSEAGMFLKGGLFGFVVYGIYNASNYSLLTDWPMNVVFIDTLWGTALCGIVSVGAYMIEKVIRV